MSGALTLIALGALLGFLSGLFGVGGSSIATPFAPPRPGNTPMMTPRMTPANISTRFFRDSAIAKPCINDWTSSI